MSQEQIQLVEKTQRLLHGPLKHVKAAALAAFLLPLASVAVSPASAQSVSCPSAGTISGFVWNDLNQNGLQDAGEPGIAGAVVSLGGLSTATDANGFYSFDLSVGFIAVCEVAVQIPPGATPSPPNFPGNETRDSDGIPDATGANTVAPVAVAPDGTFDNDIDFGFFLPSLVRPGTGTPGYWKNHPEAWPLDPITIGNVSYTKIQALVFLDASGKDKTITMFSSLLSAKLNVAFGTNPSCVASTIVLADAWMIQYGPVGKGVEASSLAWKVGEPLHRLMDNYNNGMLCAPHRN